VRLSERRIPAKGGLVRADGTSNIARLSELDAAREQRRRIIPER
jgi:hypothetical protein